MAAGRADAVGPGRRRTELASDRSENWRKSSGERCRYDQATDYRHLDDRQIAAVPDDAIPNERGRCEGGGRLSEVADSGKLGLAGELSSVVMGLCPV